MMMSNEESIPVVIRRAETKEKQKNVEEQHKFLYCPLTHVICRRDCAWLWGQQCAVWWLAYNLTQE